MKQASKESADFNRITQILRKQQAQPAPSKNKFLVNPNLLNQKTDRKSTSRFSPSPSRLFKKEGSQSKKETSLSQKKPRKKDPEPKKKELELLQQIQEAEKLVQKKELLNVS